MPVSLVSNFTCIFVHSKSTPTVRVNTHGRLPFHDTSFFRLRELIAIFMTQSENGDVSSNSKNWFTTNTGIRNYDSVMGKASSPNLSCARIK